VAVDVRLAEKDIIIALTSSGVVRNSLVSSFPTTALCCLEIKLFQHHCLSFFMMTVPPASTTAAYHGWVHDATLAVNAQSQYPTILGVCVSLTLFMVSVVCLRFYVRGVMIRSIGWDDWVVLASAVGFRPYLCFALEWWPYGGAVFRSAVSFTMRCA